MKEDKDRLMEGLWMLYEAEGAPRNISIGQFCMDNNVNYNEFYKWYKSMHHGVYQLQIDGKPDNIKATTLTAIPSKEYRVNPMLNQLTKFILLMVNRYLCLKRSMNFISTNLT